MTMNAEPGRPASGYGRRLFLHEPGWKVGRKEGSTREFCYAMAPGQDYYHRLLDGELYLFNSEERLCFACAERRGLFAFDSRTLREPLGPRDQAAPESASELEIQPPEGP